MCRVPSPIVFCSRRAARQGAHVTANAAIHVREVRDRFERLRALRQITRDAPDRLRTDAAIIAYSRNLDSLIENLTAPDDMGLLAACIRRLDAHRQSSKHE